MNTALKAIDGNADLPTLMTGLAAAARAAARVLALASAEQKNLALEASERAIRANAAAILAANAEDVAEVRAAGATSAFIDRLTLTPARIEAMADGVATVRGIADPVGAVTERWQRPNGLTIERVRVPLGVIAVIFESRPNVAADAGVLCLKSGNAVILRGGAADTRAAHLRIEHDRLRHLEIGGGIDIDVVDAFEMREHRHPGLGLDARDETLAAARHDHVHAAVQAGKQ